MSDAEWDSDEGDIAAHRWHGTYRVDVLRRFVDAPIASGTVRIYGASSDPDVARAEVLARRQLETTRAGGLFGSKRYADQEQPRPSGPDAVDDDARDALQDEYDRQEDDRQHDDAGRAQIDYDGARADDDAIQFAIGLMHGDGDDE